MYPISSDITGTVVACHTAHSPLGTVVNAHVYVSIANFLIQENFDGSNEPWTWDLLPGVRRVKNGYLFAPNEPG